MESKLSLEGRIAIITGGARGIGRRIAEVYVEHGAVVVVADILDQVGEETAKELGSRASYVHCDISAVEQVRSLIESTADEHGRIDILVNNAAYNPIKPEERTTVDRYPDDAFSKTVDVDVNGTFYCSKYASQQMIEQKSGCIISIASVAGMVPLRNQIGHVVGKAAVVRMTEAMAVELGSQGIRVNAISPGSTVTEATRGLFYGKDAAFAERAKALLSFVPLGRPATTHDIANAALFLASDLASYITGHNMVVDGGWICGFSRDF